MHEQPCICSHVRRGARALTALYDAELAPANINVAQFSLLRHVERLAPVGMSDLARATGHERSTLARSLNPLVSDGRIVIRPGHDRRKRMIKLTAAGRTALDNALPYWHRAQRHAEERLDGEQAQLLTLLAGFDRPLS